MDAITEREAREIDEANASGANPGVTEIVRIPDRGHALTIGSGWREVADTALGFVQRFVEPWRRSG